MKITDTLDQLLRALLSASEDDARDARSTSGIGSSESAGARTPIRDGVPAWRVTDDASPEGDDGDASGSSEHGPRFTTADAEASQPSEHVLPEWVRRSQERALAPVEPELVPVEVASSATDVEPHEVEEPSHVEVGGFAGPNLGPVGRGLFGEGEPEPVVTEPFVVEQPTPAESDPAAVAETASVEADLYAHADPGPVESGFSAYAELGPVEGELSAVESTNPVESDPAAVAETASVDAGLSAHAEPGPVESGFSAYAELSAVESTNPVESDPAAVSETNPVESRLSAYAEFGSVEGELPAVESTNPVEYELSAVSESAAVEVEPVEVEERASVESEPSADDERSPFETDLSALREPDVVAVEPSMEEQAPEPFGVENSEPVFEPLFAPIEVEWVEPFAGEEGSPGELGEAVGFASSSRDVEPRPVDELDAVEVDPLEHEPGEQVTEAARSLTGAELAGLETAARLAESLNLGFHLGLAVERIATASAQGSAGVQPLREATWLIERYVALMERRPIGADLHLSATRLARTGDVIAGMKAIAAALDAVSDEASLFAGEESDHDVGSLPDELEAEPEGD